MLSELQQLRRLGVRHVLAQVLNFVTVLSTALAMWKGMSIVTNTESPIVVVLSGSMEPAFYRGDLLFLALPPKEPLRAGDIPVYNVPGAAIPIVHRIIEVHDEHPKPVKQANLSMVVTHQGVQEQWIMTKGDNNPTDDISLYNGLQYLQRSHIVGKVKGYVPFVGYVTIAMNDFPKLKYALLAVLGGFVLLHRE
ncbi:uncharacterized protein L969DRAFT_197174 [Mixia osmundae IAM 14324]|uniref:Signal peptidase complex catalytic subunit SEC11 n=1 Tax=Mixia osmundae (strain CBS 9802 / IAM 14324 / JCM 22182 / KY 12970) TaxID=764103 RepID=G7DWI1_MIXOS|nr:uncharacterized protein L969DRAFT_197174 [Mixia osmundae IAM 14324]KEI37343.1 hypothetical protein L969DRAFT_197174 [Mixia osmundae IAM 14324]GAA94941.1 hypothetical protein E5Q_01596 [Mixia osmundae IAM 14324]